MSSKKRLVMDLSAPCPYQTTKLLPKQSASVKPNPVHRFIGDNCNFSIESTRSPIKNKCCNLTHN